MRDTIKEALGSFKEQSDTKQEQNAFVKTILISAGIALLLLLQVIFW